jgi:hypothetical protein
VASQVLTRHQTKHAIHAAVVGDVTSGNAVDDEGIERRHRRHVLAIGAPVQSVALRNHTATSHPIVTVACTLRELQLRAETTWPQRAVRRLHVMPPWSR